MTSNSTLDPDNFPAGKPDGTPIGHDIGSLGPSDSSDSGSDMAGSIPNVDDTVNLDRNAEEDTPARAKDIDTDRVVAANEAGLGGGLDQAEEAQLGIRDDDENQRS